MQRHAEFRVADAAMATFDRLRRPGDRSASRAQRPDVPGRTDVRELVERGIERPEDRYLAAEAPVRYQTGEVHARSWIRHGRSASPHAAGRSSSGRAAHCSAFQRQLGFSRTRA